MYVLDYSGYTGNDKMMSKFGFMTDNNLKVAVSLPRFQDVTGKYKPLEGDLIWFPTAQRLFEIKYADDDRPFIMLSKSTAYFMTLHLELYTFSYEDIQIDKEDFAELTDTLYNHDVKGKFGNQNIDAESKGDSNKTGFVDYTKKNPFGDLSSFDID